MKGMKKSVLNSCLTLGIVSTPLLTGCIPPDGWFLDADGDGFGNPNISSDTELSGYVQNSDDCNDSDASINPDAAELADLTDNNCDGRIDEGIAPTVETIKIDKQFISSLEDTVLEVAVSNSGLEDLIWTLTERDSGGCSGSGGDIAWLSMDPTAGTTVGGADTPVQLTFAGSDMADGRHTGTLCLQSNDPNQELMRIPLEVVVGAPSLYSAYHVFGVSGLLGAPLSVSLPISIENNGVVPVDFVVRESTESDCSVLSDETWLEVTAATTSLERNESTDVTITLRSAFNPSGDYDGKVCFFDTTETILLESVPVSLTIL